MDLVHGSLQCHLSPIINEHHDMLAQPLTGAQTRQRDAAWMDAGCCRMLLGGVCTHTSRLEQLQHCTGSAACRGTAKGHTWAARSARLVALAC